MQQLSSPSISLLNKLKEGKLGSIEVYCMETEVFQNVILLFDEIYLQIWTEYPGEEMTGMNNENEL